MEIAQKYLLTANGCKDSVLEVCKNKMNLTG